MDPLDIRRNRPALSNANSPLRETASQTAGPYVHIGCLPNRLGLAGIIENDLISNKPLPDGNTITVAGQVFEGEDTVCTDAMLEFWHADETGDYANGYWTRTCTDLESGFYRTETVMPGSCAQKDGVPFAPFMSVWTVARGINIGLLTRIYFPEFESLNADDPHLQLVAPERRQTLIAQSTQTEREYRFDIHLQGSSETVFFDT